MNKDSAKVIIVLMMIFVVKQTSGCCCIIFSCYCNIFFCNCENPYGYDDCYFWSPMGCFRYRELCSDKRMERSNDPVMKNIMNNSQYIKLYGHLIGIPALDVFYYHDLNKVASIIYLDKYHIFSFRMA